MGGGDGGWDDDGKRRRRRGGKEGEGEDDENGQVSTLYTTYDWQYTTDVGEDDMFILHRVKGRPMIIMVTMMIWRRLAVP